MPRAPVFPEELFRRRRGEVLQRLRAAAEGPAVAVFAATPVAVRNHDVEHPYRADSDLFWLTGFEEPEAVAVLSTDGAHPFTLFVRPRDREKEIWNGRRAGVEGAQREFGADQAFEIARLDDELPKLVGGARTLFYRLGGTDESFDLRIARVLRQLRARARGGPGAPARLEDPGPVVHELRLRKGPEELGALRRAVELTRRGHRACMAAGRPGAHEYLLHALLDREFRGGGGRGWGYPPIVATGANATVLHYTENDAPIRDGDLVLVDAGAEVDLYTADVTRTFPASGRFSPPQRACYEVVLRAADEVLRATKPGVSIDALHELAVRTLTQGMVGLGLLSGDVDGLVKSGAFRRYYMHRTSHWLGLDVHDAGAYKAADGSPRALEPGMVFTVEPGLYVAEDDGEAPAALRGIGIRIEDDVLVTAEGCENLTAAIPRSVDEVEAACR